MWSARTAVLSSTGIFTSPNASEPFQIAAICPPLKSMLSCVKESKEGAAVERHICDVRAER